MIFQRVMGKVPSHKRDDMDLQRNVLRFLKLGGERLARARLDLVMAPFPEEVSVVKPRPLPIVSELDDSDSEESEDEKDPLENEEV